MKHGITFGTPVMLLVMIVPTVRQDPPEDLRSPAINVSAAAKRIDRMVEADIKRAGLQPNEVTDDATFLRRAYLGIVGRIPTVTEALTFLDSQKRTKRSELIDSLLDSQGYVSHMFNFWADLLRAKTRLNNRVSGEPFIHFIKQSLIDDKPYDQFVSEMLAAEGPAHERDNGATGLLLRDRGMPLASMANTARVFLGTRLECAQCHDHPTDKWTQKDFYQMAAFTGGIQYRSVAAQILGVSSGVQKIRTQMRREKDTIGQRALNQLLRPVTAAVTGSGTGKVRLPKDYQYDDAKPNSFVNAKVLFGEQPRIQYPDTRRQRLLSRRERRAVNRRAQLRRQRGQQVDQIDSRTVFAEWLTSPKNPRFTSIIANRMWKSVMGRGLIEPVDNLMDDTEASNPALMTHLGKLMVDVEYDLKQFLRILYNTQTFQRQSTREEIPADEKYYFQGPLLRRMTAEQVWDSMLTLAVRYPDQKLQVEGAKAETVFTNFEQISGMSATELSAEVDRQRLRYTDPQKFRQTQQAARKAERQARQRAQRAAQQAKQAKVQPLRRQLNRARRAGDRGLIVELEGRLRDLGVDPQPPRRGGRNRGRRPLNRVALVRASELPSPAPDGHFIRQFGQSDREQIQASHTEANVPQVLSMLNGFIENNVLGSASAALPRAIAAADSDLDRIRVAYLGTLGREPGRREEAMWALDLEQEGDQAIADLIWTLVNTHEFRFIQ